MRTREESSGSPLVRAQAEAAVWISLLHSSERNAEMEAGLRRWIAADPLHARAWEAATDIWTETGNFPRRIPRPPARVAGPRFRRPLWVAVATLCLVTTGLGAFAFRNLVLHPRVSTAVGEQRTLNLEDGTRVELNTDSHLVISFDRHTRTVVLNSGEAYFQVARERRPFIVVAGERRIVALGTAFTVRRDKTADGLLTVTLIEGRVAVGPADAAKTAAGSSMPEPAKVLAPGERLRIREHAASVLDSPPIDKATGWMHGQLIFDHTPLREAIAEFNRYSALKIKVASPETGSIPVGGIFRISDSKSFARAVADTYDLRVVQHDGEILLDTAAGDTHGSPSNTTEP